MKENNWAMPETLISLGQLPRTVVLQTVNLDGKTFAFLEEDGRYLVTVEGIDRGEDAAKEWFARWFETRPNHRVKITSAQTETGQLFVFQIRCLS